jgi:hypothetical protein
MIFDDLNDDNFLMFAMREYINVQCIDIEEFYDDLKKIKYIKRLFNVFNVPAGTRILFYKIEKDFWPMLKTFLIYLDRMPDTIESIRGEMIRTSDIQLDDGIVTRLRSIKV